MRPRIQLSSHLMAVVALLSIVLVRAPVLHGDGRMMHALVLVPFLLAIGWATPHVRDSGYRPQTWMRALIGAYLLVLAVTLLRGAQAGVYLGANKTSVMLEVATVLTVTTFGYRLFTSATTERERWWRTVALALAPAMYVAVNLVLMHVHVPGVTLPTNVGGPAAGEPASLLAKLGVSTVRAKLPMSAAVNDSGAVAAAGLAACLILAATVRRPGRWLTLPAAAICLYAVLLADSRTALAVALAVVLLFVLVRRAHRFSLAGLVVLATPVIAPTLLAAVGNSSSASLFSRGSGDVVTGNGRLNIWNAALTKIQHFDTFHLLFGWGANGQKSSGTSLLYAKYFRESTIADRLSISVHDLPLQTMLDSGLVGLLVLAGVMYAAFVALRQVAAADRSGLVLGVLAIMLVLVLNGATEALPSYLFSECLTPMLVIAGAAVAMERRPLLEPVSAALAHTPIARWHHPTLARPLTVVRSSQDRRAA